MAEPFQLRILGSKALLNKMGKIEGFVQGQRLRALFEDAGQAYVILARRDAPKATRTLVAALNYQVTNFGTPHIRLLVGFDNRASRWARFVEFGSGPSVRYPRMKRYMHWFSMGKGGTTVQEPYGFKGQSGYYSNFRKVAEHPGTRPQPFFLKHLPKIRTRLLQGIKEAIDQELRAASGPRQ